MKIVLDTNCLLHAVPKKSDYHCILTADTVAFFRTVKEKMAKATEGMTLQQKRDYWKLMREGKIKLT